MKPWNQIPIIDNLEPLISIEKYFKFIDPHPYYRLGAPYKNKSKIWSLREGVVDKLMNANKLLKIINRNYSLIIYDAWRPIEVQSFMFNRALETELNRKGLSTSKDEINNHPEVLKKVERFWAYPNLNKKYPPPHSTGAAIDLTIIDGSGDLIDMGCEIDNLDGKSVPDFYKNSSSKDGMLCNNRRNLLRNVMCYCGFSQHPNEWWHFSYGDQLWAWQNDFKQAIYGRI